MRLVKVLLEYGLSGHAAGDCRLGWFRDGIDTRQTNSFIINSIEAGILLGGNGVLHAMAVAHALVLVQSLPVTD